MNVWRVMRWWCCCLKQRSERGRAGKRQAAQKAKTNVAATSGRRNNATSRTKRWSLPTVSRHSEPVTLSLVAAVALELSWNCGQMDGDAVVDSRPLIGEHVHSEWDVWCVLIALCGIAAVFRCHRGCSTTVAVSAILLIDPTKFLA